MGMLVIGILTTVDVVVLRALFNSPIPGSNEFLSTIFAVAIAAVLAGGLAQRANLEVDLLANRLGKTRTAWLRAAGSALFVLILVVIAWRVCAHTYATHQRGQATVILQWPTWPFLWTVSVLLVLCVPVQFIVFLCQARDAITASGRRWRVFLVAAALLAGVAGMSLLVYFGVSALQPKLAAHGTGVAVFMCLFLWVLILLLIPVSAALVVCGVVGTLALMGSSSAMSVLGSETMGLITNADLAVIPLFLLMGGFASASGMSGDLYRLAHALFGWAKGGLAYATIGGCAGFGSVAGTSMATVATVGAVAVPEMKRRGYSPELTTGCVTAGGTLGQLVPPGTAIVIYALLVEESIGRLFVAIIVPGLLTALMYFGAVWLKVRLDPASAPGTERFDRRELLAALKANTGVFAMFGAVWGGMFSGVFTATEAAAVGAAIAFGIALWRGKLRGRGALWAVMGETTRSTAMIYFLIIGAMVISFLVGTSGLPEFLTGFLIGSGLPGIVIIYLLVVGFILLGTAMDGMTIMIITAALVASMVTQLGYNPVWWGIMMVVLVELGEITPPFGMNLFMMKSLAPEVPLRTIFRGCLPFVVADCIKVVVLITFPAITLWLPNLVFNR
jgi:C4-dicarboxylate transporter DctM subunit